jgi:tetratricopeptide (TPR) repeat protein
MTRLRSAERGQDAEEDVKSWAALAKLESLFAAGRYAEVITLAESMLARPGSDSLKGEVRFHLAMTYLQLGKPDLGKPPLAEAKAYFQAVGDPEMIVECIAAEAAVACLEQRPYALALGMQALAAFRCLTQAPAGLELRILSGLATAHFLLGQWTEAIETFEQAIELADPVVDMRRLGKLLGNVAVAYRELDQLPKAVSYSTRALALFETLRDHVSLAREENNLACYLISNGELAAARRHLERSFQLFEQTDLLKSRGLLLLSFCELCLAEGNVEQAVAYASAAIEAGERENEAWSVADSRMWLGRALARLGDEGAADDQFHRALVILEESGMAERLVQCHAVYAEVLERRGELARAYEHLKAAVGLVEARSRSDRSTIDAGFAQESGPKLV